jgi:hypothetical protein
MAVATSAQATNRMIPVVEPLSPPKMRAIMSVTHCDLPWWLSTVCAPSDIPRAF